MTETGDQDVTSIDPDQLFRRILDHEIGTGLTFARRAHLSQEWNSIRHCFEDYAERLSPEQHGVMGRFFLRAVQDRRRRAESGLHSRWKQEQRSFSTASTPYDTP